MYIFIRNKIYNWLMGTIWRFGQSNLENNQDMKMILEITYLIQPWILLLEHHHNNQIKKDSILYVNSLVLSYCSRRVIYQFTFLKNLVVQETSIGLNAGTIWSQSIFSYLLFMYVVVNDMHRPTYKSHLFFHLCMWCYCKQGRRKKGIVENKWRQYNNNIRISAYIRIFVCECVYNIYIYF